MTMVAVMVVVAAGVATIGDGVVGIGISIVGGVGGGVSSIFLSAVDLTGSLTGYLTAVDLTGAFPL